VALTKNSNISGASSPKCLPFLYHPTLTTSQERVNMSSKPATKTFGKSTREVPAASEKAKKWYNAEDDLENKKVSFSKDASQLA
jgi:large subunit ribosomal protein L6e